MSNDVEIRVKVRNLTGPGLSGVRGNVAGAAGAIRGLSVAGVVQPLVLGLAASMGQLAGAAALLPGAVGAAGAIFGTLGIGLSGVSTALTATSSSAVSTGQSVSAMARQIRDATRAIESAQQGVADANRRLEDAYYGVEQAAERLNDAHRGVSAALRRVNDAQEDAADAARAYARAQAEEREALAAIDDARQEAIRTLQDLAEAQSDSTRNVHGAELALKRALADQAKVMKDTKATYLDREEAAHRVEEAEDKLSDSQRSAQDATEKLNDAQAKGVEGSDAVVEAQERAASAHERTQQAAERAADASEAVGLAEEGVAAARRDVAAAERGVAMAKRDVEDAERGVAEAEQAVSDAIENLSDVYAQQAEAARAAAGGANAYADALAKLSPNARAFVELLRDELRPEWEALTRTVQDRLFEGFTDDVRELADTYIPNLTEGLSGIAGELNSMARYAMAELLDPEVVRAVNEVLADTASFLNESETALGDFLAGFIELAAIGSEYLPQMGAWLADIARNFREWVETDPEGVREFIDSAITALQDLWAIGENIVAIIGAIGEGLANGAGEGEGFLGTIRGLTESILEFVESEGTQNFLAIVGWIVQKMIEWMPVTLGVIGAIGLLKLTVDAVAFAVNAWKIATEAWSIATKIATGVQWLFNLAMRANPIGIVITVIGLLVAAFIWAWNNIDGFREFWIGVWDAIVGAFNWAKDGIVNGWNWLLETIGNAANWIGNTLSSMWDGLTNGLKAAVNGAIWLLNGLIGGVNTIIDGLNWVNPFGDIPYVPYVRYLATGGNASGTAIVGEAGPEMVRLPTGSSVVTAGDTQRQLAASGGSMGGMSGGALELRIAPGSDGAVATMFMNLVRTGKIQLVQVAR